MKPDFWQRLTEAARRAPQEPPAQIPFGFDLRVLADGRTRRGDSDTRPWTLLLRGALVCSALIMVLSVVLNYRALKDRDPGPVAIADSAIQMSLLP